MRRTKAASHRTRVLKTVDGRLGAEDLRVCVDVLREGGLIVFPTDTVYGVGCSAFSFPAVGRIYELKGRSYSKPLPVLLGDIAQLALVAKEIPKEAMNLIETFWPGALTLVFKTAPMALHATRGKDTIAVRIPDHGVARQLLDASGVPLLATSANESGKKSAVTGAEVRKIFQGRVDVIIDGGRCRVSRESSVVDASQYPFTVLREGALSKEALMRCLPV